MLGFKVLKLKIEADKNIFYNKIPIIGLKKDIEDLIKCLRGFDAYDELVSSLEYELGQDQRNLAKGYNYILETKTINKDTVKELYDILSNGLLDDYSIENMGEYYRQKDVYILDGSHNLLGGYDKGIDPSLVSNKMDDLFEYINTDNESNIVDIYIKSQIIHYYIGKVHPYFDINGRTARTLSMWYLIKQKEDPLIMFNKGMYKNRTEYKKAIIKCNKGDITPFIEFTLKTLKSELEEKIDKDRKGPIQK
ncbi:MAG: Fic family protein [Bacilli bacterium]|nr:Fic family protein [Bacilli bacterium]